MQNCPKGFFRDAPNDLRCIQCAQYCADCNSINNCFECEPGCTLYRGFCYLIPTTAIDNAIDFQTYLESGAGIVWDDTEAPDWQELMSRRLQPEDVCDINAR